MNAPRIHILLSFLVVCCLPVDGLWVQRQVIGAQELPPLKEETSPDAEMDTQLRINKTALLEGGRINAMIMMIIIGANLTQQVILMTQIPQNALAWVQSMEVAPWIIVLAVNVFLFVLGMPLEAVSILVITLPILYPLITGLGFSGLWFAVIMVINMEMALISPPEGLNLFILQNLAKATAAEVTRGVIPFIVIMAGFLFLICIFPELATWLPALMQD